jgi:hypothetical protein
MNITIRGIRDKGVPDSERIVLEVSGPTDVGRYFLLKSESKGDGGVSTEISRTFWFPDKPVTANDIVVLYTRKGTANEKKNESGSVSHFFYWGLDKPVWNTPRAAAVLARVADWKSKEVE